MLSAHQGRGITGDAFNAMLKPSPDTSVLIPLALIIGGRILNFNRSARHGVTVRLEVASSVPHDIVERIILKVAEGMDGLVKEPKPEVLARGFQGEKIVYEVRVYANSIARLEQTRSDLVMRMQDALLRAEGSPLS